MADNGNAFDFGLKLKQLREENSLLQKQVAERIGVSAQSIKMYEANETEPGSMVLRKLALLYQVSADELLGIESEFDLNMDGLKSSQRKVIMDNARSSRDEFRRNNEEKSNKKSVDPE